MAAKNSYTIYRDAKTGQFVTEEYANKHPNSTVKEKGERDDKPAPKKKK